MMELDYIDHLGTSFWDWPCPRTNFRRIPLIGEGYDAVLEPARHVNLTSILPDYKCYQMAIAIIYVIVIIINAMGLILMHIEGIRVPAFRIHPSISSLSISPIDNSASRLRSTRRGSVPDDIPPEIDWPKFDYDFQRFDIFFSLFNFPIPIIFAILILCSKRMVYRLSYAVSLNLLPKSLKQILSRFRF